MSILYDKKTPDWDKYIPAVLFSYRASVNDTTGYSPFFMETGRHPTLPMHTFFPFLRKKEEKEEDYVSDIVGKLDRAFEKARQLQYDAAVKNEQIKGINRYEPDFKPGDWLLVWKRAADESRWEAEDGEEAGKIPTKLRNPWIGPFRMVRWASCVLDE